MPANSSSPVPSPVFPSQESPLKTEYEQVNDNFRMLSDIRFKLLALIPTLAGASIYVLSHIAISAQGLGRNGPLDPDKALYEYGTVVLVCVLGFLATLGITIYDQRNTELYNALIGRAKKLEKSLGIEEAQFNARPKRGRRLLGISVGHDSGLTLIYGPVLGAWFFPLVYAAVKLQSVTHPVPLPPLYIALLSASIMALIFIEEFLRLDGAWRKLWPHASDYDEKEEGDVRRR
jgi:hypothetical protein